MTAKEKVSALQCILKTHEDSIVSYKVLISEAQSTAEDALEEYFKWLHEGNAHLACKTLKIHADCRRTVERTQGMLLARETQFESELEEFLQRLTTVEQ